MPDPGQGGVVSVQAEDGGTVKDDQATDTVVDGPVADGGTGAPEQATASRPEPESDAASESRSEPDRESPSTLSADPGSGPVPDSDSELDPDPESDLDSEPFPDAEPSRARRPVATGVGCAALLLPLIAVAGAILCFAAGILSAASGCAPNGSALCSANGPWFAFTLPLFVSPLIAAGAAIGAVTVRRHRSTWLAVGYGVVFISVIVGLASASTGSG
jgi:hypothetical protein